MLSVIAFFSIAMQTSADLKVWQLREANLDDRTLGVVPSQVAQGVRIPMAPPQHFSQPLSFATPQGTASLPGRQWMPSQGSPRASTLVRVIPGHPTTFEEEAKAPKEASKETSSGPLNVFGEKLQGCVTDDGDICEYTEETPDVCIRSDEGFNIKAIIGVPGEQKSKFSCKSVWKAEWKSFRLPGGKISENQAPQTGDTTKCQSVPAAALDSSYAKENWDSYFQSKVVLEDTKMISGGFSGDVAPQSYAMKSRKGRKFRVGIDFICATCALYAESDAAKETLMNKCKALGWDPENPVSWQEETPDKAGVTMMFTQTFPSIISNPALLLIVSFVGGGGAFLVLRFGRSASGTGKVALLEAM